MALTASDPSWDDEVVPALRKRLETESRTLAHRLSGLSLVTAHQTFASLANAPIRDSTPQLSRRSEDVRPHNGLQSSAPLNKPAPRSRTISQPASDLLASKSRPSTSGAPNGSLPRPTRIPKVSKVSKPTPTFTTQHTPPATHVNGLAQLYTNPSLSSLGGLSHQASGLLNEPPPFQTDSMSSTTRSQYTVQLDDTPRLSNDSEERPFEHWYRGEVSRNGGVGELRVGRRQEMLDIATYGHTIAKRIREATMRTATTISADDSRRRKKRADSVGRVLDEDPLTDLDNDADDSDAQSIGAHATTSHQIGDFSTSSEPPLTHDSRSSTPTPTSNRPSLSQRNGSSRIPSPTRPSFDSRATIPRRGASEPSSSAKSTPSSAPSTPRAHRHQPKETGAPTQKRAVSPMSYAKNAKPSGVKATRPKVKPKPKKEMTAEEKRTSIAAYPLSGGDDNMADAIPCWTQPKLKEGNWDEVVLPVVARKKGLEDHYEQADGSPQPKRVIKSIEPAPGTFGFNHSKYRGRQEAENIPMDEFGRPDQASVEEKQDDEKESQIIRPERSISYDEVRLPVRTPPSPAPFADYAPIRAPGQTFPPIVAPHIEEVQAVPPEEDKGGAGCCKCVIM
ncbi:hypothetical protein APHAL10511_002664 [Amanita phalloides]|nr:hypothetical protein APHAL10511_002664 [Amanita phalloides]